MQNPLRLRTFWIGARHTPMFFNHASVSLPARTFPFPHGQSLGAFCLRQHVVPVPSRFQPALHAGDGRGSGAVQQAPPPDEQDGTDDHPYGGGAKDEMCARDPEPLGRRQVLARQIQPRPGVYELGAAQLVPVAVEGHDPGVRTKLRPAQVDPRLEALLRDRCHVPEDQPRVSLVLLPTRPRRLDHPARDLGCAVPADKHQALPRLQHRVGVRAGAPDPAAFERAVVLHPRPAREPRGAQVCIAEDRPRGGIVLGPRRVVAPADENVPRRRQDVDAALRRHEELLRRHERVTQRGRHGRRVEVDQQAAAVVRTPEGLVVVGAVVEDGKKRAVLVTDLVEEACVVLPGEVCRVPVAEVREGVVLSPDLPEELTCASGYARDGAHVTRGNQVVARERVFVDAVDVEEVPGSFVLLVGAEAVCGPVVIGCPPLEEELAGLEVDLLEDAVEDLSILHAVCRQVGSPGLVRGQQRRPFARDLELVKVTVQIPCCCDVLEDVVRRVEHQVGASPEPATVVSVPERKVVASLIPLDFQIHRLAVFCFHPNEAALVVQDDRARIRDRVSPGLDEGITILASWVGLDYVQPG